MPTIEVTESEVLILKGLRQLLEENNEKQLDVLEANFFEPKKHVSFTKDQLMEKWGCKLSKVNTIIEFGNVKPLGMRGRKYEYDIDQMEEAKKEYEKSIFLNLELNKRANAI